MHPEKSISERIVDVILCRLRGIRKADGYRTDAGLRVFDSVRTIPPDLPAIIIFEGDENPKNATSNSRSLDNSLQILIEGHVPCDSAETGRSLRELKADIKKSVAHDRGIRDGSGSLGALTFTNARANPRQDGDATESVLFTFTASFKEGYGDPYVQS